MYRQLRGYVVGLLRLLYSVDGMSSLHVITIQQSNRRLEDALHCPTCP